MNSKANPARGGQKKCSAFTLTELLVVVATLAILGMLIVPALAANRRNPKLIQCLSNLREIGVGCSVYADDFADWYPIWGAYDAAHPVNVINGIHYTRYVFFGPNSNTTIPQVYVAPTFVSSFENLGYLYAGKIISDAHAFFCPSFSDALPSSAAYLLSPNNYSNPQFLSTNNGSGSGFGTTRASYMFNPRINTSTHLRKYQKSTDAKQLDVFTIDYLADPNGSSPPGVPFNPDNWEHWPYKGVNTLYTDGSARFAGLTPAQFTQMSTLLTSDESAPVWAPQYNTLFNYLRDAP